MDPASLSIVAHALEPMLGLLALAVLPIGLVYLFKSHKIRMRELDLQEKMLSTGAEARLSNIESRLGAIEEALGSASRNSLQERAAMLEGPATSAADPAAILRTRDR